VPLGFEEKLTLKQIIEKHPKGIDYGYIIKRYDVWPLLKDHEGKILSLPPIINSNDLGRITEDTENILVEITGTREDTVNDALTIMCTTLADRGGKIESVEVDYPYSGGRTVETPILSTTGTKLAANYVNKILGVELTLNQISTLLKKSRFGVKKIGEQELHVEVPCYRKDILHPIDIVEDVAIAYNLNQVPTRWPPFQTFGALTSKTRFKNFVRSLAVGYGLQEIISFSLTNEDNLFRRMNLPKSEVIEVDNPKTPLYTSLRTWMIPSLMDFLQHNTHYEYPQRIFEIGECVSPSGKDKSEVEEQSKIGIATAHKEACFTEVKSILDSFIVNLGTKVEIEETRHNSFIEGRVGKILMKDIEIGVLGELNPIVLENWNLTVPVSALEMKITTIAERYKT